MKTLDPRLAAAIADAVHAAIAVVGIDGLRSTSMFPSASKRVPLPLAA